MDPRGYGHSRPPDKKFSFNFLREDADDAAALMEVRIFLISLLTDVMKALIFTYLLLIIIEFFFKRFDKKRVFASRKYSLQ